MGDIHLLPRPAEQPVAEVVEKIEEILAQAKKGRIRSVALAWVWDDRVTGQCFADGDDMHGLSASIAYLQHRYVDYVLTFSEPRDDEDAGPAS